ncbi:hypothetical protein IX51_05875 [uncultured archaeon]|nr:hypothetical protein IX51_05875 [uncultured archaeon]
MSDEETFTSEDLRKDVETIDKITKDWRQKMEYLPADQQFAMFRRAVRHIEKGMDLVEKIMSKFITDDENETGGEPDQP